MSEYTPSWARGSPDDIAETPESEQYGDGVNFDHEAARGTTGKPTDADDSTKSQPPADTPAWVDDSIARTRGDLTPDELPVVQCAGCIDEPARAAYQLVEYPHPSAFFQLLGRHGLECVGMREEEHLGFSSEERLWVASSGLRVEVIGDVEDEAGIGSPYNSYITVSGPADNVASFVEDLLEVAASIKRELRAASLVCDADAAQSEGRRVSDDNRLVDRSHSERVVSRLPEEGEER